MARAGREGAGGWRAARAALRGRNACVRVRLVGAGPMPAVHAFVLLKTAHELFVSVCHAVQQDEAPMREVRRLASADAGAALEDLAAAGARRVPWTSVRARVERLVGPLACFDAADSVVATAGSVVW